MGVWLAVEVEVGVEEDVGAVGEVVFSMAEGNLYRAINPGAPHDVVGSAGQREEQSAESTEVEAFDRIEPQ